MKDCELVKLNLCLGCVGLAEKDWCGKEQCEKYKRFKEAPISIVQGHGGPIEMAQMANTLIDVAEQLKREFPEIQKIIPMLNEHCGMKTSYKKVESWEELK